MAAGMMQALRLPAQILGVTLAYCLAGQLGLLQAIPPGYATAIWPASGFALAGVLLFGYRVWPGVLLGSFLTNIGTSWDPDRLLVSLALPFGIGVGAALQAVAGAFLVRHLCGYPNSLTREQDVAMFLIVAVPTSCLINATLATIFLRWAGALETAELGFQWWTWWAGDTIGAFVVAPLVLLWTAGPRTDWPRRPITVTLPLAALAGFVVFLFVYTSRREKEAIDSGFQMETETLTRALESRLDYALESLHSMRNFHGKLPDRASEQHFVEAAQNALARRPSVHAITWLPRISAAERPAFEAAGKALRGPEFAITQGDEADGRVPAAPRSDYFPILYRQPAPDRPGRAYGYDIASEPRRQEVMTRALETGVPVAGPPMKGEKEDDGKYVLVYLAVYREGSVRHDRSERREGMVGYLVGILHVGRMLETAWKGLGADLMDVALYDDMAPKDQQLLFKKSASQSLRGPHRPGAVQRSVSMDAAGRRWTLHFAETPEYLSVHRSLQAWSVLAGGMIFTGLLGGVLLIITGRASLIAGIVEARTAELAHANRVLTQEINDRERAEEELRKSREESRLILETAADAFIGMDILGTVIAWNRQAESLFGWPRGEALGRPLGELVIPQKHRQVYHEALERFLKTGESHWLFRPIELTALHRSGREFPVEMTIWPIQSSVSPSGLRFNAFIRDISKRKEAEESLRKSEESLRQSEEQFRLLVEGTADFALYMLDPEGRVASWNAGAERIKGYHADEILGRHFACFFTEEDVAHRVPQQALETAARTGRFESEGWRVRKDGSRIWANGILTALRDGEGRLKGFSKITRDLTERQRAEAALEESRRLIERVAETIPSILYVYDLSDERYVFVNHRVQTILGYAPEDIQKPGVNMLRERVHPDDLPQVEWADEQMLKAEGDEVIETRYRIRHAEGEWRWLHAFSTVFVRDEEGPKQILCTLQDITDLKRLEQQVLDVATQEQRRIGQELHDGTGQELTGLCMLADNLADALSDAVPTEETRARRIAQGLRQSLGHVRALSRGLVPVEVDGEGLMSALEDLAKRIRELHDVDCVFACQEPVRIEDNQTATQLYRIAQEAITNALKHGRARSIRVSLETSGHYITLKVMDDGEGLPAGNGASAGTGLRIMKYRASQIGGQLSVRPAASHGAVVTCTIFRGPFHD